jgi:hypothetical protein
MQWAHQYLDFFDWKLPNRIPFFHRSGLRDQKISLLQDVPATKAQEFRRYREANIDLCPSVFDRVIAVSECTRSVLIKFGLSAEYVDTLYIGTRHASIYPTSRKKLPTARAVHIGYLGYARHDKGFYFFLACFEAMPDSIAADIEVTVAAKIDLSIDD